MRVDLWDHEGGTAFAEYKNFRLGNEKTAFKLKVGEYSGNAGNGVSTLGLQYIYINDLVMKHSYILCILFKTFFCFCKYNSIEEVLLSLDVGLIRGKNAWFSFS